MPHIDNAVGKGGRNDKHDVAVIQTALAALKGRDGRPLWRGRIDGRCDRPLEAAIANFETAQRLPATGRLMNNTPALGRLEQALPRQHRNLRGCKGSVAVSPVKKGGTLLRDRTLEALAAPPDLLRALADLRQAAFRQFGVSLCIKGAKGDARGFLELPLSVLDGVAVKPLPAAVAGPVRTLAERARRLKVRRREPLVLASAEAIYLTGAASVTTPAGHRLIDAAVGKGAANAAHNVAAVQAALAHVAPPGGGRAFWTGSLTGNPGQAFTDAITAFQIAAQIAPTAKIEPGSDSERALLAALPQEWRTLRGIPGTNAVFVGDAAVGTGLKPISRLDREAQVLLAHTATAFEQATGLALLVREVSSGNAPRAFVVTLGAGHFLDSGGGRRHDAGAPDSVVAILAKAAAADNRIAFERVGNALRLAQRMVGGGPSNETLGPDAQALYGTTSFLVGRGLKFPGLDQVAGHLFIVAGARYIGDPQATVYSFGETALELPKKALITTPALGPQLHILPRKIMGRVRGMIDTRSKDTHEDDRDFWTDLDEGIDPSSTPPLPPAVTPIIGDESRVRWLAENVVQNWPYAPVPKRGLESNSNSVCLAIANRASEQGEVSLPESPGVLNYPGSALWADVRFGSVQ